MNRQHDKPLQVKPVFWLFTHKMCSRTSTCQRCLTITKLKCRWESQSMTSFLIFLLAPKYLWVDQVDHNDTRRTITLGLWDTAGQVGRRKTNFFCWTLTSTFSQNMTGCGLYPIQTRWENEKRKKSGTKSQLQDVFLACFSVVAPESFENIEAKWLNEVTICNALY